MRLNQFSSKQYEIFQFMTSSDNYLICDGAVRSGKTVCMTLAFVLWAMSYQNGANFAICGKTVGSAERNVITPFMAIDGMKDKVKYKRMERYMEVTINGRRNRFYVFGGKDESSYQLLQGITLAGVLLDEVALMPQSFVDQALARTLTYKHKKIWFNCNPEGTMHWFNQEWVLKADSGERSGVTHLHFLMSDNPIMGADEIEEAERMFSGVFYQRYILGMWVMAEGLIYDMFDANVHVLKEDAQTEGEYYISSDFGIQNATVFLLWRKERGSQRWICLKEWYYSGRENKIQKTVDQLVDGLESILPRDGDGRIIPPKQVIIDPSALAMIAEVRKRGYHVRAADNDVLDGINDVSTMIRQGRIGICQECRNTIAEFSVYAWDAKAADRGEDRPIKVSDHAMDAMRYFVRTLRLVKERKEYKSIFS